MRYTWDEAKRKRNLKDHGLDFVDAMGIQRRDIHLRG
jgi:uncharacterized DUF497 family protein